MNYKILKAELADDPLSRGYDAMSDAEAATDLNTEYQSRAKRTLDASEIYEAIKVSEFQALGDGEKLYVRDILSLGANIIITSDSKAREVLLAVFDAQSDTRTALVAAGLTSISRAEELGLGRIKPGYVQIARR